MNPLEKIIAALKKKVAPAPKPAPTPQPVRQSFATQKQSIAPPIPMPVPTPARSTPAQPRQVINTKVTKTPAKQNIVQKGISNLKGNIKNFQDDDFKMYGPKVVGEQVTSLLKSKSPIKTPMDYGQDFIASAAGGLTEAGVASVTVPRSNKATTAEKAGAFIGGVGAVTAPVQSVQIGTLTSAFKKALNRDKPMDLEGDIASGAKTAGVLKATGPIVSKVLGKVASRIPQNSLVATGGTKAIQSGLNVAEGIAIDKATGMPTTPASVAIDAVTGAAGSPNIRAGKFSKVAGDVDSNAVAKTLSEKDRLISEAYSTVKNNLEILNKPVKSIDEQYMRDNAEKVIRETHQSIFKVPKKTQGEVSLQDMVDDIYHAYDNDVIPKLEKAQGLKMGIRADGAPEYKSAEERAFSLLDDDFEGAGFVRKGEVWVDEKLSGNINSQIDTKLSNELKAQGIDIIEVVPGTRTGVEYGQKVIGDKTYGVIKVGENAKLDNTVIGSLFKHEAGHGSYLKLTPEEQAFFKANYTPSGSELSHQTTGTGGKLLPEGESFADYIRYVLEGTPEKVPTKVRPLVEKYAKQSQLTDIYNQAKGVQPAEMKIYHGTTKSSLARHSNTLRDKTWFTPNKELAEKYAKISGDDAIVVEGRINPDEFVMIKTDSMSYHPSEAEIQKATSEGKKGFIMQMKNGETHVLPLKSNEHRVEQAIQTSGMPNTMGFVGNNTPSKPVDAVPSKAPLIESNPTVRGTTEWAAEKSRQSNPKTAKNVASLSDTIVRNKDIDVKSKVNLVDYLRTPDRVLTKMGLAPEAKLIRQKYDDYLRDLPKEIDKITAWSKQVSPESNRRIFQSLDGQKVTLDAKEARVAGEVREYLKEWADKLGLPEDGRIASYITHIFEKDFIQKEFDPELASLIRDRVPGSVYDPFLQERLGKQGYIEDTWRALDAYVKRATRKFHMDPALERVSAKAEGLEDSQFNYVKSYVDRINMRPTKLDNLMDNTVKSIIGYKLGARPVAYVSRLMRQAVFRGALGLNVGSALKNLTQGANTYAKLGEKYTAVGYTNLVKSVLNGSKELEEVGVLRDDFVQDRTISATKQTLQKVDKVLFALFETAERINRGSAYFGAKAKGLSEGMSEKEAIEYARNIVRDTQFTFGSVDTPILLQSDIGKTVAQFQSFTLKQTEFLAELAKNKDYAGLLRYTAGSLAMVYSIGQLFGMEPKDMIPAFRIGVPPTLKTPVAIAQAAMGTPDKYGNVPDTQERIQNVGESMVPLIPGGVQIKKTLEGVGTVRQGYDTTKSGLVKYPVEQTPENYVRGGLFGKYNLPASKGYEKNSYLRESDSNAIKQLPPEKRQAFYEDQLDERAMDKVVKEKNKLKQEAIDAYLGGDETKAAALQSKHGIAVKMEDIKRRQTEYKNKAIDAYLDGSEDAAAEIQGKYGLDVKQADVQKRAKSRAIAAYKRYVLTKNPKYERQAAELQSKYGFKVSRKEVE